MIAGFSGTRLETTLEQRRAFRSWIDTHRLEELHHGACVGADEVAATVGAGRTPKCVAHPPINPAHRSAYALGMSDVRMPEADYLIRNREIVNAADVLLAMPNGPEEQRSGTWATVRYARQAKIPIIIFWPSGKVTTEGHETLSGL